MADKFQMTGSKMTELKTQLEEVKDKIDKSYSTIEKMRSAMISENEWSGEAANTFICFSGLLEQYHKDFASSSSNSPVKLALEALEQNEQQVDDFYTSFTEYNSIEGIG